MVDGTPVAQATADPATSGTVFDATPDAGELEAYRQELTGYCYRMLGAPGDAEDAVQETLVRAWRAADRFEGRSSLRTWLYRIATNVCLDELRGRQRRIRPMDLAGPTQVAEAQLHALPDGRWLEPAPDARMVASTDDPAELAAQRESVRLAFVAALQHLPARQRAVLLLREVLRWPAVEVAELLETSTAAVNSSLQRARATLASRAPAEVDVLDPLDDAQRLLLARYLDAFERYDMRMLRELLHDDAIQSMPPFDLWLRGRDEVVAWMLGPGAECEGSRLVPTSANGVPAFGQYRRAAEGHGHEPWGLHVLDVRGGRVVGLHVFLDVARLFPLFDLADRLEPRGS